MKTGAQSRGIVVRDREFAASLDEFRTLVECLDEDEGMVYGCEYVGGRPFVDSSLGFLRPPLVITFDDGILELKARDALGKWLADLWPDITQATWTDGVGRIAYESSPVSTDRHPVIHALRKFMRAFAPGNAPSGLFGAWNFDYYALAGNGAAQLGIPARPRFVLYLPDRLLVREGSRVRGIELQFDGAPACGEAKPSMAREDLPYAGMPEAPDDFAPGAYADAVARAIERIDAGEVVSLTLSQAFRRPMLGSPARAFQALRSAYAMPEMFLLHMPGGEYLLGASPDLQLRVRDGVAETAPVCGTLPRGRDPIEDAERAFELLASEKEAAAIALCSDHYRDRLARVCEPGTVELVSRRRLHHFAAVIHTVNHLRARPRADSDALDMLLNFAAPGVVSGIPTVAALRAIGEIEVSARQWFGGAVGQFGFDGSLQVGTILRSAWIHDGIAEIRAGGVLVGDSQPASEEKESRLKAQTLLGLIAGERTPVAAASPTLASGQSIAVRGLCRVHLIGPHAFDDSLADFFARIGLVVTVRPDEADLLVVSGGYARDDLRLKAPLPDAGDPRPYLSIGSAAVDHLQASGARCSSLQKPRYGVPITARPSTTRVLELEDSLVLGTYAHAVVRADDLPSEWTPWLVGSEGDVLVAAHQHLPHVAMACRPDSNISLKQMSGQRLLLAVLCALQQRRST
ncbi:MAG: chorismate-binding protein [Rubrivivax sp.]